MGKRFTEGDDALLAELGVETETGKTAGRTPEEERVIAGFEEIQRFVDEQGRPPQHGEDRDIFERLYSVRLDRIREQAALVDLVRPMDRQGLLMTPNVTESVEEGLDDDALLTELGVEASPITELRHVRPTAERRAAEEIASRSPCTDFATFRPLFDRVQKDLNSGIRETRPFEMKAEIEKGRFFIVGGQKALVAEIGDIALNEQGRTDARMRVIFDNGTESNMLMRSLQRALNRDGAGRRITEPTAGPLFAADTAEGDEASGTIYVLRSRSDLPLVARNRDLLHKIGVTNMDVERRIAGAHLQPTFLMAGVEVVATYELYNINRGRLEKLIHRFFSPARLDIEVTDRFGNPVVPREWFLVPLAAIDSAVDRIRDGTITRFLYDPAAAELVERNHRQHSKKDAAN